MTEKIAAILAKVSIKPHLDSIWVGKHYSLAQLRKDLEEVLMEVSKV